MTELLCQELKRALKVPFFSQKICAVNLLPHILVRVDLGTGSF